MHKIKVRKVERSLSYKWKNGFLADFKGKKSLYEYWCKVHIKNENGYTLTHFRAERKRFLYELVKCYSWFVNTYNNQSSDFEIQVFGEYYEIYLTHFLAADTTIIKMGGKHDLKFINFLSHIYEVDYIWTRTKAIVEEYKIDWLIFSEQSILFKS